MWMKYGNAKGNSSGMLKSSMSKVDERWHLFRGAEGFVRRGALRVND
jgi:hypothetical protein